MVTKQKVFESPVYATPWEADYKIEQLKNDAAKEKYKIIAASIQPYKNGWKVDFRWTESA